MISDNNCILKMLKQTSLDLGKACLSINSSDKHSSKQVNEKLILLIETITEMIKAVTEVKLPLIYLKSD